MINISNFEASFWTLQKSFANMKIYFLFCETYLSNSLSGSNIFAGYCDYTCTNDSNCSQMQTCECGICVNTCTQDDDCLSHQTCHQGRTILNKYLNQSKPLISLTLDYFAVFDRISLKMFEDKIFYILTTITVPPGLCRERCASQVVTYDAQVELCSSNLTFPENESECTNQQIYSDRNSQSECNTFEFSCQNGICLRNCPETGESNYP